MYGISKDENAGYETLPLNFYKGSTETIRTILPPDADSIMISALESDGPTDNIQVTIGAGYNAATVPFGPSQGLKVASEYSAREVTFSISGLHGSASRAAVVIRVNKQRTKRDVTWLARNLPPGIWWSRITFGNGKFYIVGSGGEKQFLAVSPDALDWDVFAVPGHIPLSGDAPLVAAGGKVIECNGGWVLNESDGSWTQSEHAMGLTYYGPQIAYGNGRFVSTRLKWSDDALIWNDFTLPTEELYLPMVQWTYGRFYIVDRSGITFASDNGIDWSTDDTLPADHSLAESASSTRGRLVWPDFASNSFFYSVAGKNWQKIDYPRDRYLESEPLRYVIGGAGKFVFAGNNNYEAMIFDPAAREDDEQQRFQFTRLPLKWQDYPRYAAAYGNGRFVFLGPQNYEHMELAILILGEDDNVH